MRRPWLARLTRLAETFAVPELASFIVAMNASVWALSLIKPEFPERLTLEPHLIMQGEFWRVLTFLFIPPASAPIWTILWLYLLFLYGRALEEAWGEARFNLYYGLGAAATVAAALGAGVGLSNAPLNASLFLAFAALNPEFEVLLFFILPVKVRWLAWAVWTWALWTFLAGGFYARLALASGFLNYAVFFGRAHWDHAREALAQRRRRRRFSRAFREDDQR